MARNKYNIDEELDAPFNWHQFKRSLVYVKKYRKQIILMFALAILSSLLALLTPRIQAYIIDRLIPQGHKAIGTIIVLGVGYFLINVGTIFINRRKSIISTDTSQSMTTDMRTDVYVHLQKLGFDYYDSRPHGKILTRVINYVNNVSDFLTNGLVNAILALINLVIIFVFMLTLSPKMTLVVLAGLPIFAVYVALTKPMQRRFRQKAANKQSNVTAYLSENITGVKVTQAFAREEMNSGIFDGLLKENKLYKLRAAYVAHGMYPIAAMLMRLVKCAIYVAAVYWFRKDFILEGVVQIGAITAMVSYSNRFWAPIMTIGNIYNQLMDAMSYLERIFQVLDEPVSVEDDAAAKDLPPIDGHVQFVVVVFEYE